MQQNFCYYMKKNGNSVYAAFGMRFCQGLGTYVHSCVLKHMLDAVLIVLGCTAIAYLVMYCCEFQLEKNWGLKMLTFFW